ncbi:MAG: phosphotransferase [Caldilineaceae bacterium]|nr:phosphotransferase [Caldilineaceae bacterium]
MQKGALLGQGRTAEIFAWGEDQILKLYRDFAPVDWAEHELRVGRAVFEAGLAAPAIGELVEVDGRRGLIYERVDGPTLLQSVARRPWTLAQAARQLATLHAQMHNTSRPELPSQREQLRRSIHAAPQLTADSKARIWRRLSSLPGGDAVCHGDYHPDNILLSARGPIIIDWMTASAGNPAADVARTTLLFLGNSLPPGIPTAQIVFLQAMRRLYYALYLRAYRRQRPMPSMAIQIWLPILAAARLNEQIPEEEAQLLERVARAFGQI